MLGRPKTRTARTVEALSRGARGGLAAPHQYRSSRHGSALLL